MFGGDEPGASSFLNVRPSVYTPSALVDPDPVDPYDEALYSAAQSIFMDRLDRYGLKLGASSKG